MDLIIVPLFLLVYYLAPLRRIDDTAVIMTAYGRNGEAWKRQMLRQYWRPPLLFGAVQVGSMIIIHLLSSPPHSPERTITATTMIIWFIMVAVWPLVFCIRANSAFFALEAWREADLERRIAAGIANSNDIHGYIQTIKEREYNRGHSAGRLFP